MADEKTSVQFTEEMKGYVSLDVPDDYEEGFDAGREDHIDCMFHLTIKVTDIDFFLDDPEETAEAEGYVECEKLGGRLPVSGGIFNLFVDAGDPDDDVRNMRYHLPVVDEDGRKLTMVGHKVIKDHGIFRIWHDTTTLYTDIVEGHPPHGETKDATVVARGILHILPLDFAKQMTTIRASGPSKAAEAKAIASFGKLFAGTVMDVYGPKFGKDK